MNEITNNENQNPISNKSVNLKLKPMVATTSTKNNEEFEFSESPSLEHLRSIQSKFVRDRNWNQFQTPRNLLLAMVNEVGELAECFQWRGEVEQGLPDWNDKDREHLGQEISDVFIYLMRLAEECHIDLPVVAAAKIEQNKAKYPVEKFFGTSKKYNQ